MSGYNFSTRMYIRSLERAARADTTLPSDPASPTDSRAVAAAAELSDSELPATGATLEAGTLDTSPSIPLPVRGGEGRRTVAKLGLRYER